MSDLTRERRVLVLAICCMSLLLVGLDNTIINVALPSIGRDLSATTSGLQWTVDAYTLVLASLLMLSGSTADRLGRRRIFLVGLTLFGLGSLLCSVAPGLGWLIAFRALQAVGGSMLNPVAMSIITNVFTDPRERAQAIGVWGGTIGISLALGPILGGLLVESIGWRSIFWINVPVALAAIVLTFRFVPESRAARPRRVDPVGQLLVLALFATLTYAIIEGPNFGWTSGATLGLFGVSIAALVGLLTYEPRSDEPLIQLQFFRSAPFSGATVIAVSAFAALGGFLFLNTLYLQQARGLSALHAGLLTLPLALMTAVFAPISGRIVGRSGPRVPLLVAGIAVTVSSLMLMRLNHTTSTLYLLAAYVVFGLGFGMVNAPITNAAVSGMPRSQAGVAAAVASTSRQLGQSLGVAVVGALAAAGVANARSNISDSRIGWILTAGCGVAILVVGLVSSSAWARRTADRAAAEFEEPLPQPLAAAA
jgi:EmrB/QacA subfamily drug resistance transporter